LFIKKICKEKLLAKRFIKDILISVRIGHEGLSDAIVMELSNQLNNRPLVKVKANQGVAETSEKRKILFNSLAKKPITLF
jgi:RNA-binding protein YhbY